MSDDNCSICKKEGRVHGHFSHWKDDAVAASGELLGTVRIPPKAGMVSLTGRSCSYCLRFWSVWLKQELAHLRSLIACPSADRKALQTVNTNTPDNGGEAAETGTTLQGSDAARLIVSC